MRIETDKDLNILNNAMSGQRIPNTFIPIPTNEKYINLSTLERTKNVFKPVCEYKRINNYIKEPNVIVEKIAPDEIFIPVNDLMVPGVISNTYYISNYGRLFSMYYRKFFQLQDRDGYYRARLVIFKNCQYSHVMVSINRLVMLAFQWIPNSNMFIVNHLDGNTHNNYILNLEWCTKLWNTWHKENILNKPRAKHRSNLPASVVVNICEDLCSTKYTFNELIEKYKEFGVTYNTLMSIKRKHSYTYITKKYDFPLLFNKLDNETVLKVCELLNKGYSEDEICKNLKVSKTSVYNIKHGIYYSDVIKEYNKSIL